MSAPPLRGVLFDLDGTLVDSGLDFDRIREEMGLPPGAAILETLDTLPEGRALRCRQILARHEEAGARRAAPMPGVNGFLERLDARGIRRAVVTRNTRHLALAILSRLSWQFDPVIAREDGPVKPDPAAVFRICEAWAVAPAEVLVIGDFKFDIEAGRRAGARTVLFTRGRPAEGLPGADDADFHLTSFTDAERLLLG